MSDDIELTLALKLYNQIIFAESSDEILELEKPVKAAILKNELDDVESMLLNLALQMKANYFLIREQQSMSPMMMLGSLDDFDFSDFGFEQVDPEEEELHNLKEMELEDAIDGNVVSLRDFKKKDKE